MTMTDIEIRTSYRDAKDPHKQIFILAELNNCKVDKIKQILNAGMPKPDPEPEPTEQEPAKTMYSHRGFAEKYNELAADPERDEKIMQLYGMDHLNFKYMVYRCKSSGLIPDKQTTISQEEVKMNLFIPKYDYPKFAEDYLKLGEDPDKVKKLMELYNLGNAQVYQLIYVCRKKGLLPAYVQPKKQSSKTAPDPSKTKYEQHAEICKQLSQIYKDKNTAYGDAFGKTFTELGPISALTRMSDKWNRIKALMLGTENNVADETLIDTLFDMANYNIMTAIELLRSGKNGLD